MAQAPGDGTVPQEHADLSATDEQLDLLLKIVGAFVATGLGALTGLFEALLVPLRLPHSTYLPVALVLAIILNPTLSWFAGVATKRRAAAVLPALAWCVIWYGAASKTTEGDLIITGDNWVGLVTLLVGPIAFALGVFIPIMLQNRRRAPRVMDVAWIADNKRHD